MRPPTLFLRRVHKWIGLVLGLQVLLWTVSGTAMALIDMKAVAGGPRPPAAASPAPPAPGAAWSRIEAALAGAPVSRAAVSPLLGRHAVEVEAGGRTLLFDAATGDPVRVDAALARRIAEAGHPERAAAVRAAPLDRLTFAVREHRLPIWRVDFDDPGRSAYYVSASTGRLLERRNDSWRLWDFFWMLHNMDYAERKSFNHPLIVTVGFGTVWLAITGLWLLFRTVWRPDFRALGRLFRRR